MGVLQGVFVAFLLSLFDLLRRAAQPHAAVLVEAPGSATFAEPEGEPVPLTRPGLVVYRFSAALFFANVGRFAAEVERLLAPADGPVRWIVFDLSSMNDVDSGGAMGFERVIEQARAGGAVVALSRVRADLAAKLERYGILGLVGADRVFATNREAVEAFGASGAGERVAPGEPDEPGQGDAAG